MTSGDFSRNTFDPRKQYSQVLLQQGRVQMDADWNEAQEIDAARNATQVIDIIGPLGAKGDGFRIHLVGGHGSADFVIQPGRAYLEGRLVELEPPTQVACTVSAALKQPTTEGDEAPSQAEDEEPPPLDTVTVYTTTLDNQPFEVGQMVNLFSPTGVPVGEDGAPTRFSIQSVAEVPDQARAVLTINPPVPTGDGEANGLTRVSSYQFQTYYPSPPMSFARLQGLRTFVAYLDNWHRIVTALEDPSIADPALGGADTAVRNQAIWQVKLARVSTTDPLEAAAEFAALMRDNAAPAGQMRAQRVVPAAAPVENQLYRVEIQSGNLPPTEDPLTSQEATAVKQARRQFIVENAPEGQPVWAIGQIVKLLGIDGTGTGEQVSMIATIDGIEVGVPAASQTTLTLSAERPPGDDWTWTLQRFVTPQPVDPDPDPAKHDQAVIGEPLDGVSWDGGQTVLLKGLQGVTTISLLTQILDVSPGPTDGQFTLTFDAPIPTGGTNWTLQRVVTFKWARDNASIASQIVAIGQNQITIQDFGSRSLGSFSGCTVVELTTADRQLQGRSGLLVGVTAVNGTTLTLATVPAGVDEGWIVRRWDGAYFTLDGATPDQPARSSAYVAIEDGIEVAFDVAAIYTTGDYWQIPARANTQSIEWPADDLGPLPRRPAGPIHGYMPLRVMTLESDVWRDNPPWPEADLRPHLGDLVNFVDKRGDTMTGPLNVAPIEQDVPSVTTTGLLYVAVPTEEAAAEDAPPTEDVAGGALDSLPMPYWYRQGVIEPPPQVVVNGSALIWTHGNEDAAIIVQAPQPDRDESPGPRIRLFSHHNAKSVAALEFLRQNPGEGDTPDARVWLDGNDQLVLWITSPSKGKAALTVSIEGKLTVTGDVVANDFKKWPQGAAAADGEASSPRLDDEGAAQPEPGSDDTGDSLTALIEQQATTIAAMTATIAELTERVRALEEQR